VSKCSHSIVFILQEMGLGKTLQSISILAYYYEFLKIQGPHLVCVPKSTLSNWMNELKRWCPSLRAIKFHGNKDDRADLIHNYFTNDAAAHDGKRPDRQVVDPKTGELIDDNSENPRAWDVCVTTYEVCNTEKQALSKFGWKVSGAWCEKFVEYCFSGISNMLSKMLIIACLLNFRQYLVIDEAHRLKNEASLFSNTVRTFSTTHRLLLTGTPLQNNLHELWALLNFLLPDIFSSADQFDEWFDLETDDADAKQEMISQLHKVLRPFMLRRLKADVAKGLPPKTETLVMVGMSSMQKRLYKQLLLRDIDSITSTNNSNRTAVLNIVMQLRKCCGHPYLFEGVEDRTLDPLGEHLVENCGKLFMVDKLLKRLKERGSRVLIFTQMTRVLDILEDYMVMRGYKYCRIDGNTDYSVRESSIDDFNAPNSEKFCFILSTRAGGLGINLQTADICILYDSDWNPQADLQAQDRCHRLGQKKPVNVYRLVSENTVEEKIVERAQQKLKLDAMVVQQGRLKDKDKGISKDEIMAAVRFGADTIFRSEESTITDDDIDVILERGAAKTKELAEKITKAEKGDLLDFRLDGGISAQTFEGIDYSDRDLRTQLKLLAADSIGKRERRAPPTNYNPVVEPKKSMVVNNRKIKLPKVLRLPRMEDHQFYNRDRLLELSKIEFQTFATLKQNGGLPPREDYETKQSVLSDELAQEKLELLAEGFEDWTKSQYFHFVKAATKFGRTDIGSIAADMDLAVESVDAYSQAFWAYGASELKEEEWERALNSITKGEEVSLLFAPIYVVLYLYVHIANQCISLLQKIAKQRHQRTLLQQYVSTFDNPRTEMSFANKGTVHFASEQDRALLCAVDKYGTENLDEVRETILNDDALLFQHPTQSMSNDAISKRVAYRMRQMVKELDAREKKMNTVKPPQVIAAEEAIKGIKEMDLWESNAFEAELRGAAPPPMQFSSNEIKSSMEERLRDRQVVIERFREIEIQLRGCRDIATKTHEGIMRGDQYVNYSNITLKAGGQHITENGTLTDLDGVDMEAYVSQAVLAVPQCGECQSCLDPKARKLCAKRLEVREAKIKEFDVKLREWVEDGATRTKTLEKDRKDGNRQYWPRKRGSDAFSGKPVVAGKDNGTSVFKKKISPPGNPLGNKKMSVPDELLPFLCKRVTAEGTRKRMQVIQDFSKEHPAVSIRQVTFKFTDITTKDRPACVPEAEKPKGKGRAFIFYLRPRFYNLLPEDERPKNWEPCAQEDELLYQEEKKKFKEEKAKKDKSMKDMMDKTMSTQAEESSIATGTSQDLLDGKIMSQDDDDGKILSQDDDQDDDDDGKIMSQDDDDDQDDGKIMSQDDDDEMTEDESEPPIKKMKY
jgi:SWI/SNF-related matrix-associated actin-dependent regulator of chromatin subfamily A member 5